MKLIRLVYFLLIIIAGFCCFNSCGSTSDESKINHGGQDAVYTFGNDDFVLEITKAGGMFVRFERKDYPINPFGWHLQPEDMPKNNQPHVFAGHFLCTGRWGAPTKGEEEAGIPHNGEVNTQSWNVVGKFYDSAGKGSVIKMECEAPIERLDVTRHLFIPDNNTFYFVKEQFTNNLPIGRFVNFVQHPTISPPFLDKQMRVYTNAGNGFDQKTALLNIEDSCFVWPDANLFSGEKVDLSAPLTKTGFVTSHIFASDEEFGWCFAYNPENELLLGYIFKTADYPWFNYWHQAEDGQPVVRGLEFGTTGFGESYNILVENDISFFGERGIDYLDAGASLSKSYLCFQQKSSPGEFWLETEGDHIIVKWMVKDKAKDLIHFNKSLFDY